MHVLHGINNMNACGEVMLAFFINKITKFIYLNIILGGLYGQLPSWVFPFSYTITVDLGSSLSLNY